MPESKRAQDLLKSAHDAVAMAKRAGANDIWAGVARSRSVSFTYRDGTLTVKCNGRQTAQKELDRDALRGHFGMIARDVRLQITRMSIKATLDTEAF